MEWLAPCVIVYLLPLLLIRRSKTLLFWWLWVVALIGQLAIYDLFNHARLLAFDKYTSLASVGVFALCATPLPTAKWWRWTLPCMILISVAVAGIERLEASPPEDNGDWRGMAQTLDHMAGPHDPLVFYPSSFWGPAAIYYLDIAHYAPSSQRPVMFLENPADESAQRQLEKFHTIWLIGPSVQEDTTKYLPGWRSTFSRGFINAGSIAELKTPNPTTDARPENEPARPRAVLPPQFTVASKNPATITVGATGCGIWSPALNSANVPFNVTRIVVPSTCWK